MSSILQFEEEALEVGKVYKSLSLIRGGGHPFLRGQLAIVDEEDTLWHTYDVEIHHTENYPKSFPIVYETGGAIQRIADWHINSDGSCCLDNEFSQQIKCFKGIKLIDFIRNELLPWLANQSYRRVTGNYVNGEQGHGDIGRIEFFMLELKAPNLKVCVEWMIELAKRQKLPRQATCFCGSGNKWRHCHKPIFEKLQPISSVALAWAIRRFLSFLNSGDQVLCEIQKHTSIKIF